jgi:predicted ATPase
MNEQLVVKNFGPIKDATVDFKRVTVFIGPTGGGKSTLAKLAAIFRDGLADVLDLDRRRKFFSDFSIDKYFKEESSFKWKYDNGEYIINSDLSISDDSSRASTDKGSLPLNSISIKSDKNSQSIKFQMSDEMLKRILEQLEDIDKAVVFKDIILANPPWVTIDTPVFYTSSRNVSATYFTSNRNFLPAIEYSWAGLLRDDIGLPKDVLDFANAFSTSRKEVSELAIPFLNIQYIHQEGHDFIRIPESETLLRLFEAASGIQSVTPLLVLLEHLSRNTEQAQSFIIEEPELNLYPTAQQGLLNWLVEKCTKGENDLTITTHSPYILSHLNLLLYAYQVAENHPDRAEDVAKIVPRESWINPKEFAAYHVEGQQENGVRSIVNPETGLISYNGLDATANAETSEFEKLLDINAGLEVE